MDIDKIKKAKHMAMLGILLTKNVEARKEFYQTYKDIKKFEENMKENLSDK